MAIYDIKQKNAASAQNLSMDAAGLSGLQLLLRLQQTLNVEELIKVFTDFLGNEMELDGFTYQHEEEAIECQSNHHNRHVIAYTLSLEGENLGKIAFYRARPFEEPELHRIEDMLGLLIYPLNNALRYQKVHRLAHSDPLTGLRNRSAMEADIQREISLARRQKHFLSLIMIDIDHFKHINDTYGHACGDQVLRCVGECLKETFRDSDLCFRYGGEEFLILLPDADIEDARNSAERLRANIEAMHCKIDESTHVKITVSAGVSSLTDTDDAGRLIDRADAALYEAKTGGRNQVKSGMMPLNASSREAHLI